MNKILHIFIFVAVLLSQAFMATIAKATVTAKAVKIEYESVNEFNQPVTLTATITLPGTETTVRTVMLSNSATNRISGAFTQDSLESVMQWNALVENGFAIVEPDNCVMGKESLVSVPKYTYCLAGRQTIDALSAGIAYLKENGIITTDDYQCYNVGYGLGANLALAAQRSLEEDYSEEQKEVVHLVSTFAGGASAAPTELWKSALAGDSLYSAYKTVMMLDNVLKSYEEGCMKSFTEKDVFSQKVLNSYILELIYTDNVSQPQVEQFFSSTFGKANPDVSELLSDDMMQEGSAVRRAVEKALDFNNLTKGWTPQYLIFGADNDKTLISQLQGDKYCDITGDIGTISSEYNDAVKQVFAAIASELASKEDQFMASVFTKIIGQTYLNLPILAYYDQMFFDGNLYVNSDLNITLNLNVHSIFLAKVAKMTLNVDGNVVKAFTTGMAGTLQATCYQAGQIDFYIDATDVMPIIRNIAYLMQTKTFSSEMEAQTVATELNNAISKFSIDINGETNWFTGAFCTAKGTTEGTYVLDFVFTRTDGSGKSISFQTFSKLML